MLHDLAKMPVLCVEVEVDVLARVLVDDIHVEGDAKTGAFRQGEVPVDDLGVARSRVFHPRLGEVVEVLLDLEVRGRGREVERGRGGDRAADVVWSDKDVVRVRPGR